MGVRVRVFSSQAFTSRITVKKACMSTSEDPMTCLGGKNNTDLPTDRVVYIKLTLHHSSFKNFSLLITDVLQSLHTTVLC